MGFTDAFTGFFKKEKAKPQMQVTEVNATDELKKGTAFNVSETTAHQDRAQGIDAKEKARFEALYGSANLDREKRNQELADQFVNQGFSNAANAGLQSAMRQFTGAAAQGSANSGMWGSGSGMQISNASNRTADMITRGQQYGLGLSQSQMGIQQDRAFAHQGAANTLWQKNMVDPNTFLNTAMWNTTRKDETANQNKMIDWANAGRKSLFEQGIQRSMGSMLDLATNPQTQIGAISSICGGTPQQQTYPGATSQASPSFGGNWGSNGYMSSMSAGQNPFSSQGFSQGWGTGTPSSFSNSTGNAFSSGGFSSGVGTGGGGGGSFSSLSSTPSGMGPSAIGAGAVF